MQTERQNNLPGLVALLAASMALTALGWASFSDAWLLFFTGTFIWIAMSWTWNVMAVAGYVSLAPAAWYGLGAYASAIAMQNPGVSFFASVVIAIVFVALFSVAAAIPLFRLRSHYFIMGTLVIAEVVHLIMNQVRVFGIQGASLMHFPPVTGLSPSEFNRHFYAIAAVLLFVVLLLVLLIRHTRIGLALRAIGQDETTAEALGVNTTGYKLLAFGLSSGVFAAAGAISGYWVGFIQQSTVFTLFITVKIIVIAVLGGINSLAGVVIAAFLIQFLEQIVGPSLAELNRIIYGAIVMAVVVLMPYGVGSGVAQAFKRLVPGRHP